MVIDDAVPLSSSGYCSCSIEQRTSANTALRAAKTAHPQVRKPHSPRTPHAPIGSQSKCLVGRERERAKRTERQPNSKPKAKQQNRTQQTKTKRKQLNQEPTRNTDTNNQTTHKTDKPNRNKTEATQPNRQPNHQPNPPNHHPPTQTD